MPRPACAAGAARCTSSAVTPSALSWARAAPLPAWAFCLLPMGAMALGLALRTNLSAEFGLDEHETAQLELWSNMSPPSAWSSAAGCPTGSAVGRRSSSTSPDEPAHRLACLEAAAARLRRSPPGRRSAARVRAAALDRQHRLQHLQGLMYGTRAAIMMDVTNPRWPARSSPPTWPCPTWPSRQRHLAGHQHRGHGLSVTLGIDAAVGLLLLLLLPMIRPRVKARKWPTPRAPRPRFRLGAGPAVPGLAALQPMG